MRDPEFAVRFVTPEDTIASRDTRLVDVVDGLLASGVVLRGEVWLTVADVDLVYLSLDLLLTNPDVVRRCRP